MATTDKLTNALVAILEASKPDESITVADARKLGEISLPTVAVDVSPPERHSLAIPGVMKCPFEIVLRCHGGDDETRETLAAWADVIERQINDPADIRDAITSKATGLNCDYCQIAPPFTRWEDTTLEIVFTGGAWIVRTA